MAIFAFKMKLKAGFEAEYKRRHDEIWPEIVELLKSEGIEEYHIFLDAPTSTLFAVQKVSGSNSQSLGERDIVQKWWKYMADIMETNEDNSPISVPLVEVFCLR
jgi:L-rhamnose mutarotase